LPPWQLISSKSVRILNASLPKCEPSC
jgi:hypothetical protein